MEYLEPVVMATIISPDAYTGKIIELAMVRWLVAMDMQSGDCVLLSPSSRPHSLAVVNNWI